MGCVKEAVVVGWERENGKRRRMNQRTANEVEPPPPDKVRYGDLDKTLTPRLQRQSSLLSRLIRRYVQQVILMLELSLC